MTIKDNALYKLYLVLSLDDKKRDHQGEDPLRYCIKKEEL
jgi:hypothetical protein